MSCDTVETEVSISYLGDLDEGQVSFRVLQLVNAVVANLNKGSLVVEYTGEESLDTNMMITLSGVPFKSMSPNEIGYFQGVTKGFLKQKEYGSLEILSVEVQKQKLYQRRHLVSANSTDSPVNSIEEEHLLREGLSSGVIDIQTKVTGKYRPPLPGLNFEDLVEDSINADDGSFREELKSGGSMDPSVTNSFGTYFTTVEQIYAKPIPSVPTKSPTLQYDPNDKNGGLSGPISIAIVVGAALLTFGMVFGAFVLRKRQRDKQRYDKSIFDDDDEEDPLFFDSFDKKINKNTTVIPPFSKSKRSVKSIHTSKTDAVTEDMRDRSRSRSRSRPNLYEKEMSSRRSGRFGDDRMVRKDRMTKNSSRALGDNQEYENYDRFERSHSYSRREPDYDYDERIRRKENSARPPLHNVPHDHRMSIEHEERIKRKFDGPGYLSHRELQYESSRIRSRDEWGVPDYEEYPSQRDRREFDREEEHMSPAHHRFQRRPSEDGEGISIASASTSSTLSSNFTRLKQQH